MNFKQIEMVGFKSFADPIKITFGEGITAIVGPNGCGKSNVADAIRWVLGEQSSKMLRGTSMQDVIFKGTEKRKSLSFCEVSLCFDNSNKIFRSEYEEIVITRKLYRSGESEYMINRAPCRLKDIIDMLHDSGIGKSGYSIIGQGKVEEIINSKPEDRRAIFEEAAGIAKFKAKKVESERKLDRTRDNLTRINDIISEIDRQLAPLKRQSETAKTYLEYKEKLKVLEINAYIHQYDYASTNKEIINTKIAGIVEEMNGRQAELDKVIAEYNSTFEKINHLDEHVTELRDKMLELTVGIEKQAGETNLIKERLRNLEVESLRLSEEVKRLTEQKANLEQQIYNNKNSISAKENELYLSRSKTSDLQEKYDSISAQLATSESEVEDTQKKLFDALSKLGDVKAQISALNAEKNSYNSNLSAYNDSLSDIVVKYNDSNEKLKAEQDVIQKLAIEKNKTQKELDYTLNVLQGQTNDVKEKENEINTTSSNIFSMQQRLKMLVDMQKEYEGYNGSVRRLLSDAERNAELKKKIVGVVANLIKVPATYQTAIEMALGNGVQNIVTYSDNNAKELINYLKSKEYGRITFLPINTVKPRYFDKAYNNLLNHEGCFGLASDLISYDKQISNVISSLLGSTVVVNNINNAVSIAMQSNYQFRIVTLDGDIINPQGSITGGSKKAQVTNLLSRDNDISNTRQAIERLEKEKTQKQSEYDACVKKLDLSNDTARNLTLDLHNKEVSIAQHQEVFNKYHDLTFDLENQRNKVLADIEKTKQMLSSIDAQLNKLNSSEKGIEVSESGLGGVQFGDLRAKRDEYNAELVSLKVQNAQIESEIISLKQEQNRLVLDLENTKASLTNMQISYTSTSEQLEKFKVTFGEASTSIDTIENMKELDDIKARLSSLNDDKMKMQASLRMLEESRMNLGNEVSKLQDKKYQQELNLTKVDTDIETMQERVWTEYEVTYNTALEYKQDLFDIKTALPEINRIKREIIKLGNINVNAIEDYKALQERHGDMYNQAKDLMQAEDDLKKIIKELADEMTARFKEEFDKINENFGLVFKELFGGGKARLELVESDDVLEAGVDIIAEPPGKKLSNITLLSGGEKSLTAIAILFAILRLRPMPFCLLDEIEAALDEANVGRFAKYLKKYSEETQFIVITHKKPTMEHADILYGVTMEEKGVSKIVSVKLSEAIEHVEKN